MHACVRACARACVRVCVRARFEIVAALSRRRRPSLAPQHLPKASWLRSRLRALGRGGRKMRCPQIKSSSSTGSTGGTGGTGGTGSTGCSDGASVHFWEAPRPFPTPRTPSCLSAEAPQGKGHAMECLGQRMLSPCARLRASQPDQAEAEARLSGSVDATSGKHGATHARLMW